jgi:allophanate hydrolase
MTLASLKEQYQSGTKPADMVQAIYDRIEKHSLAPVWISMVPREVALERAAALSPNLPLYGVPFAVKDNIDVAGLPTTAGCPAFAFDPQASATVITKLQEAGAILIGKTNMDQFATGLVGTRSPHGACSSVFDDRYISGGSSSGSAVAVARGLVAFSLGTDTAGSGRVPAAFNGLVGLKPTRGMVSTSGVFPACRTLDCVSIFAHSAADAAAVLAAARGFDESDPYSREPQPGDGASPWLGGPFRFGVPPADQLNFFGDEEAALLYAQAIERMESIGGAQVEIDFSIFRAAADLLYSGPWVAERAAALGSFLEAQGAAMDPTVYKIISGATRYTAIDGFRAQYRLEELRRSSEKEWRKMDALFLPTTGTIFTHEDVRAEPVQRNTDLGVYTNFVNLLDLTAIAIPAGLRPNGLPFGVSLVGPAFSDEGLLGLAALFSSEPSAVRLSSVAPGCVEIAVVGAHLSGQPLNHQLTDRGARLQATMQTGKQYRFYALPGTTPAKPGMIRDESFSGPGIEVEVWNMPEHHFGGFVAGVPKPLSIGDVQLRDGTWRKCFLCEYAAVQGAQEITSFGSWRAYLKN